MGMVFGKIPVETPNFEVIQSTSDYEIRNYPPSVVAQFTYDPTEFRGDRDGGFTVLANYIGALGHPQNAKPEKIAMTAPVITRSPPAEKTVTMEFLLPSKYRFAAEAPAPVDGRVAIREEGERKYGAVRFTGTATEETAEKIAEGLRKSLERDGYKVTGRFLLARYNPPWTLPPFRTNEVLIPIE